VTLRHLFIPLFIPLLNAKIHASTVCVFRPIPTYACHRNVELPCKLQQVTEVPLRSAKPKDNMVNQPWVNHIFELLSRNFELSLGFSESCDEVMNFILVKKTARHGLCLLP
jgi:hypothetical protein